MTTCNATSAARTSQEDKNSMVEADLRKREDDLEREKVLLQRREERFVRTKAQYDLRLDLLVDLVLEGGPSTSSREWSGWHSAEEFARHLNEQRAADEAVVPSESGLFLPLQEARTKIDTKGGSKAATMAEAVVKLLVANLGVSTVPVQALSDDMQTTLRAKIEAHTGKVGMDSWKEGCLVSKANKRDAMVNRCDGTNKDGVHACSDCVRRHLPCIWQTREALTLLPLPEKDRKKGAAAGDAEWYWQ